MTGVNLTSEQTACVSTPGSDMFGLISSGLVV